MCVFDQNDYYDIMMLSATCQGQLNVLYKLQRVRRETNVNRLRQ